MELVARHGNNGALVVLGIVVVGANFWWVYNEPWLYLETLIGGLLSGVLYSLVALGFVLIFKASGVFNFAQGALALFAALTFVLMLEYADTSQFWDWTGWLALILAFAAFAFFVTSRYTGVLKSQRAADRILVGIVIAGIIILAIVVGGDKNVWRAVFVTGLLFLALAVGIHFSHGAAAVLLGSPRPACCLALSKTDPSSVGRGASGARW